MQNAFHIQVMLFLLPFLLLLYIMYRWYIKVCVMCERCVTINNLYDNVSYSLKMHCYIYYLNYCYITTPYIIEIKYAIEVRIVTLSSVS